MQQTASLMKTWFLLLPALLSASLGQAAERPNLLFIYTDDQRYDAVSVVQKEQGERGRFPWFRTPNMDRLAAEGVRFRNAFVVCSLCAPSRAVNLTGRYNHLNGIASNFRPFPIDNVTHASLLRAAGYTTAYVGKWHMDSQRERPGFDHHYSFIAHARYWDPMFIVDGKDAPTQGWVDDISTDYAIEFMKSQKGGAKPWLLIVGFKSPHGPCEPAERAKERFAGEQARVAPNLNAPVPYLGSAASRRTANSAAATVPVNLDYFRCISAADDCLGRLLDALDELGLAKNTVVIYTSDNGYYLGEHGLGDKRSAYDESLRVPFLVRYPALGAKARGRVVDAMVLNLDLAQTLLDFAGVRAPKEMQGRSWRPLLTGERATWRQSWFYEYFAENQKNSRVPDITAVRTTEAKLIRYPGHDDWTELFDLGSDPYETRNLYRDPAHATLRARLEAEHDRLAKEVGYRVPEYVDRPPWWGKPGGPDWRPDATPGLRLHFDFTGLDGDRVRDLSNHDNQGQAHNAVLVEGHDGRKTLRLQGDGWIEVPKSVSLDPTASAWTVEVACKPEKPDGMILARGGRAQGYALWWKQGHPAFTIVIGSKPITIEAKEMVTDWATVMGTITSDGKATLHVDGRLVADAALPGLIERNPNDAMQVGADLGSPVVEPAPPKFTGWIERVRLFSGEYQPEKP
jgi:arylsulfatase A-like enzyme